MEILILVVVIVVLAGIILATAADDAASNAEWRKIMNEKREAQREVYFTDSEKDW